MFVWESLRDDVCINAETLCGIAWKLELGDEPIFEIVVFKESWQDEKQWVPPSSADNQCMDVCQ